MVPVIIQSAQYYQKIIKIKKHIDTIQQSTDETLTNIESCLSSLRKENPSFMDDQIEIKRQLDEENIKRLKNKPNEHNPNFQLAEEPKIVVDKITRSKCKSLFRDISKKCHPDMTTSEELIGLFKIANDAYIIFDFKALSDIWNQLKDGLTITDLFNDLKECEPEKLLEEIEILTLALLKKEKELNNIKNSIGFIMFTKYEAGKTGKLVAKNIYSNHMIKQNLKMLMELEQIQNGK
jgi:hypothetical protein